MALKNWCFKEYEDFLLACGFKKIPDPLGSSFNHYNSPDGNWTTRLDFHGNKVVIRDPRLAKTIVENSGVPEGFWTKRKPDLRKIKKNREKFWKEVYRKRRELGMPLTTIR